MYLTFCSRDERISIVDQGNLDFQVRVHLNRSWFSFFGLCASNNFLFQVCID